MVLLGSVRRRSRKCYLGCRRAVAAALQTRAYHWSVIVLVIISFFVILTNIILSEVQCTQVLSGTSREEALQVEPITRVLWFITISILSLFMLEYIIIMATQGLHHFRENIHVFDVCVVAVSWVLEIALRTEQLKAVAGRDWPWCYSVW